METEPQVPTGIEGETEAVTYAGKFDSVEKLEEAYKSLESKLGEPREEKPEAPGTTPTAGGGEAPAAPDAPQTDLNAFYQEYAEKGELSAESIGQLTQMGFPEEIVQTHLNAVKALADQTLSKGKQIVGGEEAYAAMTQWAGVNAQDKAQVANDALARGDVAAWEIALESIKSAYVSAVGTDPASPITNTSLSNQTTGFLSRSEMISAMKKRDASGAVLYETDASYRREVEEKLSRSSFFRN